MQLYPLEAGRSPPVSPRRLRCRSEDNPPPHSSFRLVGVVPVGYHLESFNAHACGIVELEGVDFTRTHAGRQAQGVPVMWQLECATGGGGD